MFTCKQPGSLDSKNLKYYFSTCSLVLSSHARAGIRSFKTYFCRGTIKCGMSRQQSARKFIASLNAGWGLRAACCASMPSWSWLITSYLRSFSPISQNSRVMQTRLEQQPSESVWKSLRNTSLQCYGPGITWTLGTTANLFALPWVGEVHPHPIQVIQKFTLWEHNWW